MAHDTEVPAPPEQAQKTRHSVPEPGPAPPAGRVGLTTAQRSAGGQKGGKRARHVALIGLGAPLPVISLKSSADRMAVLEAVLSAVAEGRTSGMVAQTIISLVRAANELARHDQEDALAELEARLDQVLASRVVR